MLLLIRELAKAAPEIFPPVAATVKSVGSINQDPLTPDTAWVLI
jgi:hypothetical protein